MPNGNGMGPTGAGPMTGRGAGYCAGNNTSVPQRGGGKGMQLGCRGNGKPRGFFRNHTQHAVAAADSMVLEKKINALQAQIASLRQQLEKLNSKDED